jgi:polysaccharide transporter, PST family
MKPSASIPRNMIENLSALSLLQVFTYVLPLLTLPYLLKVLGVEKFGILAFAQAIVVFFNVFIDYGFGIFATREISINRDSKNKLIEIYSAVLTVKVSMLFLAFLFMNILVVSIDVLKNNWAIYNYTFLWAVGQAFFPVWYFQGIEKMKYITLVNVLARSVFTLLVFVVVKQEADYIYVPILNGVGFISGSLISVWVIRYRLNQKFNVQKVSTLYSYFNQSTQFFLSRFALTAYTSTSILALGFLLGPVAAGYYSVAEKFFAAIQGLFSPISQVLYPYVSKTRNLVLYKKVFRSSLALNFAVVIGLYFFGQNAFFVLFPNLVNGVSWNIFEFFLAALLVVVPSMLIGYPLLGALGFAGYVNKSVFVGAIVHIGGLSIFAITDSISVYTVVGMVCVTELSVFSYRLYGTFKTKAWRMGESYA